MNKEGKSEIFVTKRAQSETNGFYISLYLSSMTFSYDMSLNNLTMHAYFFGLKNAGNWLEVMFVDTEQTLDGKYKGKLHFLLPNQNLFHFTFKNYHNSHTAMWQVTVKMDWIWWHDTILTVGSYPRLHITSLIKSFDSLII